MNTMERPIQAGVQRFGGRPNPWLPDSVRTWRAGVIRDGKLPIVAVAGLRGKTTVIRLLDHIMRVAGHRTALWTDAGVEINGRQQPGELAAWQDALRRCVDGDVSVVFQELNAVTVASTGLPADFYPVLTLTTFCANDDVCQIHRDAQITLKALPRMLQSASTTGAVVFSGDEFVFADAMLQFPNEPAVVYTLNRQAPILRQQLASGGFGAWREGERLAFGDARSPYFTSPGSDHNFTLAGDAAFQVNNALAAIATARTMGATLEQIDVALQSYEPYPRKAPGTFTVLHQNEVRVVVDRPNPSWFLRSVLRALRASAKGRLIVVAGRMDNVPLDDIEEAGRLLGRDAEALILHDLDGQPGRAELFLRGVAKPIAPPLLIRVSGEGRAIGAALRRAHPRDTVLVLADDPGRCLQIVQRSARNRRVERLAEQTEENNFQDSI